MKKTDGIPDLRSLYTKRKRQIRARLEDFRNVHPREYFYELAYCLLTPQSSAVNADQAIAQLKEAKFFERGEDPVDILASKQHYIRFHRTKANHLLRVREQFAQIVPMLENGLEASMRREWLVENVKGLGWKEATHFLRNIGKNGGLTILDRHILRNLKRYGVIRSIPATITKKHYFRIEKKFTEFAEKIGIPVDELDLVFWSTETGEIRK